MLKLPQFLVKRTAKVFISYRRDETAGHVGRLAESLGQHFGPQHIFRDIEAIQAGEDFAEAINESLAGCDALLVVIGKHWTKNNGGSLSRLHADGDFVRLEISTALSRQIPVVPVLVQGASMPTAEDMPEDLAPLVRRQAFELSDARWNFDVKRLITRLEQVVPKPKLVWPRVVLATLCIAALASLLVVGGLKIRDRVGRNDTSRLERQFQRSQQPLFPIKASVGFKVGLQHPSLESYRSRIAKVPTPDGLLFLDPNLNSDRPLFPDPQSEPEAYSLMKIHPEVFVFLIRQPTDSFENANPDLSFTLRTKKSGATPEDDLPSYSYQDGVLRMFFQGYTIKNNDDLSGVYSNGNIISPLDLPGAQIACEIRGTYYQQAAGTDWGTMDAISEGVEIDYLNLEFPNRRQISLPYDSFKRVKVNDRDIYVFTFPGSEEEMERLFTR